MHCFVLLCTGTFGVIVLTIPVEGGYSGGKINVEHEGHMHSFQFEHDSDRHSSCVAFFEDCYNELETISDGWMLAMVFHLIWKDALEVDTAPLEFPAFIKAFNEINEELVLWSSPSSYTRKLIEVEAKEDLTSDINEMSCRFETPSLSRNLNFSTPNNISNSDSGIYILVRLVFFLILDFEIKSLAGFCWLQHKQTMPSPRMKNLPINKTTDYRKRI